MVKKTLKYSDLSTVLVNYKVRRKDKQSSSKTTTAEAMTATRMSSNHRKVKG